MRIELTIEQVIEIAKAGFPEHIKRDVNFNNLIVTTHSYGYNLYEVEPVNENLNNYLLSIMAQKNYNDMLFYVQFFTKNLQFNQLYAMSRMVEFGILGDFCQKKRLLTPDYATSPGATLKEWLQEKDISIYQFKTASGLSENEINGILDEKMDITETIATKLQKATGITADFWLKKQENFNSYMTIQNQESDPCYSDDEFGRPYQGCE